MTLQRSSKRNCLDMMSWGGKKEFFFTYGTNQRQVKRVVSTKKSTIHVKFHQNWYIKYSLKKPLIN